MAGHRGYANFLERRLAEVPLCPAHSSRERGACRVRPLTVWRIRPVLAATAEGSVQPSNRAAQHRRRSPFWPPRNPATVEGPKNAGNSPFWHRSSRGAGARNRGEPKAGDRAAAISRDFGPPRTCQHRCIHFRGPGHLGPTHPFPRGRARAGEPSAGCSSVGDSQYLFDLL